MIRGDLMEDIWTRLKSELKTLVPTHLFNMWIDPLEFNSLNDGVLNLICINGFCKHRVESQYGKLIETQLQKVLNGTGKLVVTVGDRKNRILKTELDLDPQLPLPVKNIGPSGGWMLRRDFTFDSFVVGRNNDLAYSAALYMASNRSANSNPLFLLSKSGLGKSHLSQAVGHHILSKFPGERVYYITSEDFTNEMVWAYKNKSINQFKEKYRKTCDVLLLEDVHFLTGKERTQTELALILDYLVNSDKKVIMSSCFTPSEIPGLNDQLRSRLSCGLISKINPPDFQTRVRILHKKLNGEKIPMEVIDYLAGELCEDVRQLESGLKGVMIRASLMGRRIDMPLAKDVVEDLSVKRSRITVETIKKLVCREYNVTETEIVSKSRKRRIVRPRQVAIYLSRRYTDASLQAIGKSFKRYHATALHSIGAIERELKINPAMKEEVGTLCRKLEAGKF
jgi:chromosomal replication initiator protein